MGYLEYNFSSENADNNDLDKPIWALPRNPYVDRWKILAITLPLSWYPVDSRNNKISVFESTVPRTYTIPPGNYNIGNIASVLQTAMPGYTVTFDEVSRKLTFKNSTSFYIMAESQGTSAWRIIGSSRLKGTISGTTVVMPNVVDLTSNSPMLLTSTSLTSNDIHFAGKNTTNVLSVIPIDSPQMAYHTYENLNGSYVEAQQNLSFVDFTILDSSVMKPVSFQGQPFFVRLGILTDSGDMP